MNEMSFLQIWHLNINVKFIYFNNSVTKLKTLNGLITQTALKALFRLIMILALTADENMTFNIMTNKQCF